MLINALYVGHESTPRIKKGTIEILKMLDTKLKKADDSLPTIEKLLKITLKKEKVEEEKAQVNRRLQKQWASAGSAHFASTGLLARILVLSG